MRQSRVEELLQLLLRRHEFAGEVRVHGVEMLPTLLGDGHAPPGPRQLPLEVPDELLSPTTALCGFLQLHLFPAQPGPQAALGLRGAGKRLLQCQ